MRATYDHSSFEVGGLWVWPDRGLISVDGNEVHLEPKVMAVLVYLANNAGEVVHKDQLLQTVWAGTFENDKILTVEESE